MSELLPCPCCKHNASIFPHYHLSSGTGTMVIVCDNCGLTLERGFIMDGHCRKNSVDSEDKVKAQITVEWNTRNEWIPVSEPPKKSGLYIVTAIVGSMSPKIEVFQMRCKVNNGNARWMAGDWVRVVGWMPMPDAMPLPAPPKGE